MKILWFSDKAEGNVPLYEDLSKAFNVVALAFDSRDAILELCAIHEPNMIVMEPCSRKSFEPECIESIRQRFPTAKICVISCDTKHALSKKAWASGADLVVADTIHLHEFMQLLEYSKIHYRIFPKEECK